MKTLLLAGGLLLGSLGVQAQGWAGSLPVDSASGKIVYRGNVAMTGASAALLRRRAVTYTGGLFPRDTVQLLTGRGEQQETRYRIIYQVTIWPETSYYRYSIYVFGLTYPARIGEGFAAGRISPIVEAKYLSIDQLRSGAPRPLGDLSDWQEAVAHVAEQVAARVQAAMQGAK